MRSRASTAATTSRGRWLLFARVAWAAVAVTALAIIVFSVPSSFEYYRGVCTAASQACSEQAVHQATPEGVRALGDAGLSLRSYALLNVIVDKVFQLVWIAVGALVFWRRSDDRMALLVSAFLVSFGPISVIPEVANTLISSQPAWWLPVRGVEILGEVCSTLFFLLFPGGRFVPRWTRWLAIAFIANDVSERLFSSVHSRMPALETVSYLLFLGGVAFLVWSQVYRYRRISSPVQRRQTRWVVFGLTLGIAGTFPLQLPVDLSLVGGDTPLTLLLLKAGFSLSFLLVPLSIGVAVLRSRLFDVDVLINRTLVYGALTVSVAGIYVLVVGYLGVVLRTDELLVSLLATGLVALLFAPLRERLQRTVNHLMYGERDDPYAVVSRLGQRLEAALAPEDVLPTVVETVREALKLPYAAITLQGDDRPVASAGKLVEEPLRLPLTYQGKLVGELLLGPRAPNETFGPADRGLLEGLARQAGVAAYAVRLNTDLQRSRERLVAAREEERRRLRRDLHDGLGAQLAGLNVQAGTLRRLIPRDPAAADELVLELREELRAAIADIRRLVYDLRPPALDDLGLVAALRQLAERYGSTGEQLRVLVEAPEDLPHLPAAIEVAVYRIAQEALTNVVHHARAKECVVRLVVADDANLEITDDGIGLPDEHAAGVGLYSMRERAAELGGTCAVEKAPEDGTRVLVRLPLSKE